MTARHPAGVPTGGQFAASAKDEPAVDLTGTPTIHDVFADWRDAEEAAEFEFSWDRMDFDDYNGWMAYDPDAPRLTRTYAWSVKVGDDVHVPGTTSVYRPAIKVATYTGGEKAHLAEIWTIDQDTATDEPAISVPRGDMVSTKTFRPDPDLTDPAQFARELERRVYAQTADEASRADERHDVVRLAHAIAENITPDLIREALAQRQAQHRA